ncbi:tripartite tricarboxylate transporter substrate binding protein [Achromobacter aloeverae]
MPYAAGGTADNTGRILAQKLTLTLGQSVIVENKGGASGVIGADYVAKAAPDGYTVMLDASAFGVNGALHELPYDPLKDFTPVSLVATTPMLLVVKEGSPIRTLADLVAAAKASPGRMTFSSAGTGTATHLGFELFDEKAGIQLVHVPYKGGAPALTDVMGGHIDASFGLAATALPYIKGGKLRALAGTARARMAELPDVPTLAESGFPGLEILEWNGVFVPAKTPPDIVGKLSEAVRNAVADAAVAQRLRGTGMDPVGNSPAEFAAFVRHESEQWQALVKARGITVN